MELRFCLVALLTVIFSFSISHAAWQAPAEVITGKWGKSVDQFGIEYGDTNDTFPGPFYILTDGTIIIRDAINGRRKIFNQSGSLMKVTKCIKNQSGEWNEECRITGEYIRTDPDGNIWVDLSKHQSPKYSLYSATGQLIKTLSAKPSELGVVSEKAIGEKLYRISIQYSDKTYELTSDATFMKYVLDVNGNVYGVSDGGVWRFNQCGKEVAELLMPVNQTETVTSSTSGKAFSLPVEYGQPVIAPNGDVFTWKKSKLKYSIVKWTWMNDPNAPSGPDAPSGLTIIPSTNGLYLTWTASPSDPGCVTVYEINRATSAGGGGEIIGTVTAGKTTFNDSTIAANTMYYYKIRAKAGSEYSPYTAEVSGKKP